jgi:hypothetical protein
MATGERELGQEKGPVCLVLGEVLFCAEIREVIMVCPYFKGCGVALEVVMEGF